MSIAKPLHLSRSLLAQKERSIRSLNSDFMSQKEEMMTLLRFKAVIESQRLTKPIAALLSISLPHHQIHKNLPTLESMPNYVARDSYEYVGTLEAINTWLTEHQAWISTWIDQAKAETTDFLQVASSAIDALKFQLQEARKHIENTDEKELKRIFNTTASIDVSASSKLTILKTINNVFSALIPLDILRLAQDKDYLEENKRGILDTTSALTPICGLLVCPNGSITINQSSIVDVYSLSSEPTTVSNLGYNKENYLELLDQADILTDYLKLVVSKIDEHLDVFNNAKTISQAISTESLHVSKFDDDDGEIGGDVRVITISKSRLSPNDKDAPLPEKKDRADTDKLNPILDKIPQPTGVNKAIDDMPEEPSNLYQNTQFRKAKMTTPRTEDLDESKFFPNGDKDDDTDRIDSISPNLLKGSQSRLTVDPNGDPMKNFDNSQAFKTYRSRLTDSPTKLPEVGNKAPTAIVVGQNTVKTPLDKSTIKNGEPLYVLEEYTIIQNADMVNAYMLITETLTSTSIDNIINLLSIVSL